MSSSHLVHGKLSNPVLIDTVAKSTCLFAKTNYMKL